MMTNGLQPDGDDDSESSEVPDGGAPPAAAPAAREQQQAGLEVQSEEGLFDEVELDGEAGGREQENVRRPPPTNARTGADPDLDKGDVPTETRLPSPPAEANGAAATTGVDAGDRDAAGATSTATTTTTTTTTTDVRQAEEGTDQQQQQQQQLPAGGRSSSSPTSSSAINPIAVGDPKMRSKLRFEVVTARVVEVGGKKHVAYTIMMRRTSAPDPAPVALERRYSDFCYVYECILRSFHPSVMGDFLFPKKVLVGNFKAEVIAERTEAFHKFLNLIANCDNLLYSDYFYSFLSSEEHNEAVSHLKLGRFAEAVPLLRSIFHVREKLLSVASVHVLLAVCELIACLTAAGGLPPEKGPAGRPEAEEALAFVQVGLKSFDLVYQSHNQEEVLLAESLRVPFLKLGLWLATDLRQDKKVFERQLSELRYSGVRLENAPTLLEAVRDRYIHRASHTSKIL